MIIQIRGTSGSGKTTVMRKVMDQLGPWEPQMIEGRKKPLFYSNRQDVVILGHYESPCGGGDTIGSAAQIYRLIESLDGGTYYGHKRVILCEGLLLSEDVKWSSQLLDLRVLFLTTPLERCLEQIKSRRLAGGNEKPLNPANTTNRVATIERARQKLVQLGIPCYRASSDQAPRIILRWIKEGSK